MNIIKIICKKPFSLKPTTKNYFFEREVNNIGKPLCKLTKRQREKPKLTKLKMKRGT